MIRHLCLMLLVAAGLAGNASAAVVVVVNASDRTVEFTIEHGSTLTAKVKLGLGESRAVPVGLEPVLKVPGARGFAAMRLDPYHLYAFGVDKQGGLGMQGIELAGPMPKADDVAKLPAEMKVLDIPVRIYADPKDARARPALLKSYKARLSEASALFERSCSIRFTCGDIEEWSPQSETDLTLPALFADFRDAVAPRAGELAIAYTLRLPRMPPMRLKGNQDPEVKTPPETYGRTGWPWSGHMLLREGEPGSEGERVEALAHYLGWHLGAVTSPDDTSIMRTGLGDGRAAEAKHVFRLDPINILIIHIWADEVRAGRGRAWKDLRPRARERLQVLYQTLARLQPDELTIADYLDVLKDLGGAAGTPEEPGQPREMPVVPGEITPPKPRVPAGKPGEREAAVRKVVLAIVARASELALQEPRLKDDELTEAYVRAAATAAGELEEPHRAAAFGLALGIALDDSTVLRGNLLMKALCQAVESDDERAARLKVLGVPTLKNRRDLCQHFVVSAALTAYLGAGPAELAGLSKELADMKGRSGFSFADLAADLAGIELMRRVENDPDRLKTLAGTFKTGDHMLPLKGLREGLSEERFKKEYGAPNDARFQAELQALRSRLQDLPGLKK